MPCGHHCTARAAARARFVVKLKLSVRVWHECCQQHALPHVLLGTARKTANGCAPTPFPGLQRRQRRRAPPRSAHCVRNPRARNRCAHSACARSARTPRLGRRAGPGPVARGPWPGARGPGPGAHKLRRRLQPTAEGRGRSARAALVPRPVARPRAAAEGPAIDRSAAFPDTGTPRPAPRPHALAACPPAPRPLAFLPLPAAPLRPSPRRMSPRASFR